MAKSIRDIDTAREPIRLVSINWNAILLKNHQAIRLLNYRKAVRFAFGIARVAGLAFAALYLMFAAIVITNAEAQSMVTDLGVGIDAGTAAVIQIRTGAAPGPEAAAGGTLLATLTCSATAFTSVTDGNPGGLATFAAITDDSSADATDTAAHFRLLTQTGGTAILEGTVGTSGADINFNTVAFTSGSTVSISSLTLNQPES